jgi:plastocyanin
MPRTLPLLTAAVLILVLAAGCGSSAKKASTEPSSTSSSGLVGTVGPGFTISLTNGGTAVKTLKPGTYKITVNDKSSIHDFHLIGPGVDKTTDVASTGTVVWTVKLSKGGYTFQCDPHAATGMTGSFTVS